jgi:hypothetical protein
MTPQSSLSSLEPIAGISAWVAAVVAVVAIGAAGATIVVLMIKKVQLLQLKEQLQKELDAVQEAEEAAKLMKLRRAPRAEKNRAFADVETRQTRLVSLQTLVAMKTQQFSDNKPRYRKRALALLVLGVVSFSVQFLMLPHQTSAHRAPAAPSYMDVPANTQREDDAASAAVEALRKFSGAAASKESWLQDLTPLVTASMAHQVQDIDPPRLKPTLVHAASLEPPHAGTGEQVRVRIGTDTGEWTVVMTRAGAAAPWLAAEIFTADLT